MRKSSDINNLNSLIDKLHEAKSSLAFIAESNILMIDKIVKSDIDYKPPFAYAEGLFNAYSYIDLTIHSVIFAIELIVKENIKPTR